MISIEKENFKFLVKDNLDQSSLNNFSTISKNTLNTPDISKNINKKIFLNSNLNTSNAKNLSNQGSVIGNSKSTSTILIDYKNDHLKEKKHTLMNQNQTPNFFRKIGNDLLKPPKIPLNSLQLNNNISLNQFLEQNKRRRIIRESAEIEKDKNEIDKPISKVNSINSVQAKIATANKSNIYRIRNSNKGSSIINPNLNQRSISKDSANTIPITNNLIPLSDISSLNNSITSNSNNNDRNISPLLQHKNLSVNKTKNEIKNLNLNLSINIKENILLNFSSVSGDKKNGKNNLSNNHFNSLNPNLSGINLNSSNFGNFNESIINKDNIYPSILNNLNAMDFSSITAIKNQTTFLKENIIKNSLLNHLKMFEINLELDDMINNYSNSNIYDNYYLNTSIKTINKNLLFTELRKYFSIMKREFNNGNQNENLKESETEFFIDENLNLLYDKLIKLQMIVLSILFVFFKNLNLDDYLKVHVRKICSSLIYPLINFFECFVIHQPQVSNDQYFTNNLSQGFREKYKKIYKFNRMNRYFSTKDNIFFLNKFSDELILMIKQFPRYLLILLSHFSNMLRYTMLRPFYSVVLQLTKSIEKQTISYYSNILVNHILYSILWEENKLNNYNIQKSAGGDLKLNEIEEPFLPLMKKKYSYTLVLDLDETLIHYFMTPLSRIFFVRPHVFEFLIELQEMFEIVIFTAGTKEYADFILDILDEEVGCLNHRLYRNHTSIVGGYIIKDLTKLGRDLSKVIIIDNIAENFRFQPNNGLPIKTWNNDIKDTQLLELKAILRDIYLFGVSDVRDIIKCINEDAGKMKNKSYAKIDITKYMNL